MVDFDENFSQFVRHFYYCRPCALDLYTFEFLTSKVTYRAQKTQINFWVFAKKFLRVKAGLKIVSQGTEKSKIIYNVDNFMQFLDLHDL